MKRVQANERDKRGCGCIECAGGVSVSRSHKQNHITPPPHQPPSLLPPHPTSGLYATDGDQIPERETNCDIINCWKREVEDLDGRFISDRVFLLSSPSPYYTSSAVRAGVGDITQNKGVLKRGMSEPRLALRLPLKPGQMPL